ncbi:MAG: glycoside hydrolase family 3 protein, partial [Pirellulales bacterium]|nr:glycoside hydrolase family 3 protein [Pirellulales bacterium]
GYSWWGNEKKFGDAAPALAYARKLKKPVFVAESTARGHYFEKEDSETLWAGWFTEFFKHIEDNKDVIRAVSYINADWDAQDMWDGWGQTRIQTSPLLQQRWKEKMSENTFVNAADNPHQVIGFTPPDSHIQSRQSNLPAYKNPLLSISERVEDLLARMTLEEKIAQITGWWFHDERKLQSEGLIFTPEFYAQKCPHGIGELGPLHNLSISEDIRHYAAIQEYFRNRTRLGIPAILHDEAAHGFMKFQANAFPAPIGLACSWNPSLLESIYTCAAKEARSRGVSHVLSPVVDVARELRWGRVDETLGEDPFLVGRLGAAMVRGLQGSDDGTIGNDHVAATLKHFAGYAGTTGGRNRSPYPNGRRHLLDTEIPPFRHIIKTTHPASVMAAFNEVNGLPCHVNDWMLQTVLRDRLGFDGLLVGDYQGLNLVRWYQKIGTSDADVGKMALECGLQLELPNAFGYKHISELVKTGKVKENLVDSAVREMLSLKFRLGLFEAPMVLDAGKAEALADSVETNTLALEAARQSIVLLKNDNNLLPLNLGNFKNIAVIGPNAAVCRLGNYSGMPQRTVSILEGIRN